MDLLEGGYLWVRGGVLGFSVMMSTRCWMKALE